MKFFYSLYVFLFCLILLACSESQFAGGGTANEGESYVYGNLTDSSGNALSGVTVVLAKVSIDSAGSQEEDTDSTITNQDGYYEFQPQEEGSYVLRAEHSGSKDTLLGGVISGIQWRNGKNRKNVAIRKMPMMPPVDIRGSLIGLDFCSKEPVEVFIPGLSLKQTLGPQGEFHFFAIPRGQLVMGVICDDAIQYVPLFLPPGCQEVRLDNIPLRPPSEFMDNEYAPFSSDLKHSVQAGPPPAGLGDVCPGGEFGQPIGPKPYLPLES